MAYVYTHPHRVRYRECDPMGVVYHTHYLDFFEVARTEALRELGLAYREVEEHGIIMPVVDVQIRYRRPAHYDDLLHIQARFDAVPTVRVPIDYAVYHADGATGDPDDPAVSSDADPLVTGQVTLCFMDADARRPTRVPESIRDLFERALHASDA
jgi:acyl-CoA thioester hydrolase